MDLDRRRSRGTRSAGRSCPSVRAREPRRAPAAILGLGMQLGTTLAQRYELEDELGRGGMGVVYLARDLRLDRGVAIKVIAASQLDEARRERFLREARVVARLDHPSIVAVYDVGEHDGAPFLVMPRVPGVTLRELLAKNDLTLQEALDLGAQVAGALAYAHARDVVHRDVKPENVLVEGRGPTIRARLTDFGLALAGGDPRLTTSGALIGTIGYFSPEQIVGGRVDGRSDVYSLATVLYECLAGRPPFAGEIQGVLYRIVHTAPQPLTEVARVEASLSRLVMACLDKELEARLSAQDLAHALERFRAPAPVDAQEVASLATMRLESVRIDRGVPLVGRAEELGELERRLNAARAGQCQLVLVQGEQGSGKTRLLDELERLARMGGARVLVAHFAERAQLPFQGYREVIEQYCREYAADVSSELTGADQGELFAQLGQAFARMAAEAPLVVILENLHEASVSIRALDYLARCLTTATILFVGSYTTSEVDAKHPLMELCEGFAGSRRFCRLSLGALSESAHRKLVAALTVGRPLDGPTAERVLRLTDGNPFFTVELVRALTATSTASSLSGIDGRPGHDAMPATIQQAIERRLGRLGDEVRDVLAVASVFGPAFDYRDLEAVVGGERALEDDVDELIRRGFLREENRGPGEVIVFTSRALQETLHASLSRRRRRRLHRGAAEAIEKRSGRRLGAPAELLVHYAEADDAEHVFELGLEVAAHALSAFSPDDAVAAVGRVLDFAVERSGAVEGRARTLLAAAHRLQGRDADALTELTRAVQLLGEGDRETNEEWLADALVATVETAWESRRMDQTERFIRAALDLVSDPDRRRSLLTIAAMLENLRGGAERAAVYEQELQDLASSQRASVLPPHGPERLGPSLAMPNEGQLRTLDPALVRYHSESWIASCLVETLTAEGQGGEVRPWLAEHIEARDGGQRYRIRLRSDVCFHDGRALTTADVRFSFERLVKGGAEPNRGALSDVRGCAELAAGRASELSGVVVDSDHELTIELVRPSAILPALLTHPATGILPVGTPAPDAWAGASLCGTGPFRLRSFAPGRRVELEAHGHYWRAGLPRSRGLTVVHGLPRQEALEGVLDGSFAMISDVTDEELSVLRRDPRGIGRVLVETPLLTCFVVLNADRGLLADDAWRERVVTALDAARVAATLGAGAVEARTLLPPGMLAAPPALRRRAERRAEPLSVGLRLGCATNYWTRYRPAMDAVVEQLSRAGANVVVAELREQDRARWTDLFDLTLAQYSADYPDADGMVHVLRRASRVHGALCGSEVLDEHIEAARVATDPIERDRLYRDIELLLHEEARLVPLFHPTRRRVLGRGVQTTAHRRLLARATDCAELWSESNR